MDINMASGAKEGEREREREEVGSSAEASDGGATSTRRGKHSKRPWDIP